MSARRGRRATRAGGIPAGAIVAIVAGGAALGVSTAFAALSVAIARTVVTPPHRRGDDVRILGYDAAAQTITLQRTTETIVPGRYGFWFSKNEGFARLGEIVDTAANEPGVTRHIERVVFGRLEGARAGRWSGWYFLTPRDLGVRYRDVRIPIETGIAPAWLIPAETPSNRWAILVHGRGVTRSETLRAVGPFREAGYTTLLVTYRNDGDAPASADHRYALGDREWSDIDAAMGFARDAGAEELLLMGYSMGGATVLQAATRSAHAPAVTGIVLDSPVVDWVDLFDFQLVDVRHWPRMLHPLVTALIGRRGISRLAGLSAPVDLARLDFVARAGELSIPILALHSDDDLYVPARGTRALASARPDLVTLESFEVAQHTRLWNYDPERWTGAVARWLTRVGPAR